MFISANTLFGMNGAYFSLNLVFSRIKEGFVAVLDILILSLIFKIGNALAAIFLGLQNYNNGLIS